MTYGRQDVYFFLEGETEDAEDAAGHIYGHKRHRNTFPDSNLAGLLRKRL